VLPVRDQRRAADTLSHPDPVQRDGLIPDESDDRRSNNPPDMLHRLRSHQLADRLPAGDGRAQRDHQHDGHAGHVLGATVPVGVAPVRRAAADHEGDPEWDRGQSIREVVDRVGEQRDAAGVRDDNGLEGGRQEQADQGYLDGADTLGAAFERLVGGRSAVTVPAE
jgi:hypothetical protein